MPSPTKINRHRLTQARPVFTHIDDEDHSQMLQMLGDCARRLAGLADMLDAHHAEEAVERDAITRHARGLAMKLVTLRDNEATAPLFDAEPVRGLINELASTIGDLGDCDPFDLGDCEPTC